MHNIFNYCLVNIKVGCRKTKEKTMILAVMEAMLVNMIDKSPMKGERHRR